MDAEEIRPLFDKHIRPVARQFLLLGLLLGALAGLGLGFMVGQDSAEKTIIVLSGDSHKA